MALEWSEHDLKIRLITYKILIYKNKKLYKEKTNEIIKNNFITNYKTLTEHLKKTIDKYKLSNLIIQNKIYILINKLYCETNLYILKVVMYNLGFSNYKVIYEEDLYKNLYKNILCIWNTNGIYIKDNVEYYIDINNKLDLKKIINNTLLITSNNEIINRFTKELVLYENTIDPIFKLIE
jgi:hypothetical protein